MSRSRYITIGNLIHEGSNKLVYECITKEEQGEANDYEIFEKPANIDILSLCICMKEIESKKGFKEFILQNKLAKIGLAPSIYDIHISNIETGNILKIPQPHIESMMSNVYFQYDDDDVQDDDDDDYDDYVQADDDDVQADDDDVQAVATYKIWYLQELCKPNLINHIREGHNNNFTFDTIVLLITNLVDNKIIHTDMKPQNICASLLSDGNLYLRALDFDTNFIFTLKADPLFAAYGRFCMLIQFLVVMAKDSNITFDKTLIDNFLRIHQQTTCSHSLFDCLSLSRHSGVKINLTSMIQYFLKNPQKIMNMRNGPIYMLFSYLFGEEDFEKHLDPIIILAIQVEQKNKDLNRYKLYMKRQNEAIVSYLYNDSNQSKAKSQRQSKFDDLTKKFNDSTKELKDKIDSVSNIIETLVYKKRKMPGGKKTLKKTNSKQKLKKTNSKQTIKL
jgi:hypothetical protein